ncbi:carnosine N-methyltransferase [Aureococcus anophagefferens]|nr:carnosine N-methyltransferase [Aureococcus anophagefferens]
MDRRRSAPPPPPSREEEDALNDEEQFHFQRVVGSFRGYERVACADAERTRRASERLHPKLERLLPPRSLERRVVENQGSFGPPEAEGGDAAARAAAAADAGGPPTRSTPRGRLQQGAEHAPLLRDWSDEGAAERAACYGPSWTSCARASVDDGNRNRQRILVPAPASRLPPRPAVRGVVPYVDQPSNVKQSGDRLSAVRIPDVSPDALLHGAPPCDAPVDFSMAAGEFLEVYRGQDGEWAGVLSCFFVDTAPVALEYVDAIFDLLEPGGYWINLGPLLYHWVPSSSADLEGAGMDDRYAQSIELSWEELARHRGAGFELNGEWRHCTYTANARSMMNTDYECIFFTARKPA